MVRYATFSLCVLLAAYAEAAPPVWGTVQAQYYVEENAPQGTVIGTMRFTSSETLNLEFQPSYVIATRTGMAEFNLTMETVFDFERLTPNPITITGILSTQRTPKEQAAPRSFFISVTDMNDNYPAFVGTPYTAQVSEFSVVGTQVFNVSTTDEDYRDVCEYAIVSGNEKGHFSIELDTGIIRLIKEVDYEEEKVFQLKISATDGVLNKNDPKAIRLQSKQIVIINIEDEQDQPPTFSRLPYVTSMVEELPVGTLVITVFAQDGDRGKPRNMSYHFLESDGSMSFFDEDKYFRIDEYTGAVTVNKRIDRDVSPVKDKGGVFLLNVQAREVIPPGSAEFNVSRDASDVPLTITILDIDDNPPRFNFHVITAWIDENTQRDVPINFEDALRVVDPDNRENGTYELLLTIGSQVYSDLYVKPNRSQDDSPVLVYVANGSAFDYEERRVVQFQITAKSITTPTKNDAVNVTLQIRDVNDNAPTFGLAEYHARVPENSASGTFVTKVTATDRDSGNFGTITYTLQGGSGRFYIDANNGSVYVLCAEPVSDCIDREKVAEYYLTIVATDGGQLTGVTSLRVNVTDVNDNAPRFLRKLGYTAYLQENSFSFQEPLRVEATDADEQGTDNSKIVYSLSGDYSQHFAIDPDNGTIDVIRPLDIETFPRIDRRVTLKINVTAADKGSPRLSTDVLLTITLEDVNDMVPYFTNIPHTATIKENAAQGTFVFTVHTRDDDFSPPNNESNYRVESGASGKFQIGSVSGDVVVIGDLDRETVDNYVLNISVTDRGTPPFTNSSTLVITILDVNDAPPVMNRSSYEFKIYENASIRDEVGTVSATDKDETPRLQFTIKAGSISAYSPNGAQIKDFKETDNPFAIGETTGTIYVARKEKLDRETASRILFVVEVDDLNAETAGQQDRATVAIEVMDVVDTAPAFDVGKISRAAVRQERAGSLILELKDYVIVFDSVNDVKFSKGSVIRQGNLNNSPFEVESTGSVKTSEEIPASAEGIAMFTAVAENSVGLKGTVDVEIVFISEKHILKLTVKQPETRAKTIANDIVRFYATFVGINVSVSSVKQDSNGESSEISIYSLKNETEPRDSKELMQYIFDTPTLREELTRSGVQTVSALGTDSVDRTDFYVAVGGCAILALIMLVTIFAFLRVQKKLRWKLRAANAATERGGASRRSEAVAIPNTNTFSKGNPIYQANGQQMVGQDLSSAFEGGVYEKYRDTDYQALDLLGEDGKQTKPIDHQAVLQALVTDRRGVNSSENSAVASKPRTAAPSTQPAVNGAPANGSANQGYDTTEI